MTACSTARSSSDPQVALRPEPFGALAYHYGNRRLVFLKHPDMVAVARGSAHHDSLAATLAACDIDRRRWPSFADGVRIARSTSSEDRRRERSRRWSSS